MRYVYMRFPGGKSKCVTFSYDYVNAYNSLIFSADGNIIYNPTLYSIWVDIDKKVYEIKSGETIKL